jgi:hypothetical protein
MNCPSLNRATLFITCLAIVTFLVAGVESHAEFIQTMSSGVYQSTDGRTKVVLGNNDGAQGIFILQLKEGVSPQEFTIEKTPAQDAAHIFIKFDPSQENGYPEAIIGERSYIIAGNVTFLLGDGSTAVNIDNTNPYLTVTQRDAGKSGESVLGFYGMTPVVQGSGNLATILTANQLNPEIAHIIKPYIIKTNGVYLNDKPIEGQNLGIFVKRDHECLRSTTALLTLTQLKQIQAAHGEALQAKLIDQFLHDNVKSSPTKGHLVLRADPASPVVMLNIADKNVVDLRAIKNSFSARKICVLSPVG